LVVAIESGIVKIPRLPVSDTTGRPEPRCFRLWKGINDSIEPGERLPGAARRPKPDVVYREAEGAPICFAMAEVASVHIAGFLPLVRSI
jgi:type III restriction enzyme